MDTCMFTMRDERPKRAFRRRGYPNALCVPQPKGPYIVGSSWRARISVVWHEALAVITAFTLPSQIEEDHRAPG